MFDQFGRVTCQECAAKMTVSTVGKNLVIFNCENCGHRASISRPEPQQVWHHDTKVTPEASRQF